MGENVVVFGTGKMAQLAHFYFTNDSQYNVVGFTVDAAYQRENNLDGLPLVPFEEVDKYFSPNEHKMFIATGYKKLNSLRKAKYLEAKKKGYSFVSYMSSRISHWGDTVIGENCFILENQIIQPFVNIGNNVVIWGGSHFGHDAVIKDHCWIAAHVVVSGGVTIDESSFIGINATIRDNVKIGKECIVGAGAVILNDTKDKEVYITKSTELYRLNSEYFERMMDISR